MRLNTKLIHGGHGPDPLTGAVTTPIYQTSTFRQTAIGEHQGYEYSRTGNPTRAALEQLIADLEEGDRGLAFASGMGALSTILMLFSAGDHLIVGDDVYGGTFRVLARVFSRFGLKTTFVDTSDLEQLEQAFSPHTRAVLVETPTNPLMKVTDLRAVADMAHAHNALFIVDNTFMTPYLQRPLALGADIVWHSATKYLGGHSDVIAGLVVSRTAELGEQLHYLQNAVGAVLGPQDSFLLMRGMRTLGLRMREHDANALALALWLEQQPQVKHVYYPGLPGHPGRDVQLGQASGFGGMLSFDVGSGGMADDILSRLKVFTLAESLGAVESLISLPARMTHASIPADRRAEIGIGAGLLRISAGIEDVADLIDDLAQAFAAVPALA